MARTVKWYIGTLSQCEDLVSQTNLYHGWPNEKTKTQTWAIPEQNPLMEEEYTIPFNQWIFDNLEYDPTKLSDEYPFELPEDLTSIL